MKNMKANTLGSNIRTPEAPPPKKRNREIATGKEQEKLDMLTPSGRSSSPDDQGKKLQSSEKPVILNKGKEKMIESPPKPTYVWRTVPVGFQTKGISIGSPPISLPPDFRNAMFSIKSKDKPLVTENAMISSKSKDQPPVTQNAMISSKSKDQLPVTENDMISSKSKDKPPVNENSMIFTKSKDKSHVNGNAMISSKSKDKPSVTQNAMISSKSKDKPPVNENSMIFTKSKDKSHVNGNAMISSKSKVKPPVTEKDMISTKSKDKSPVNENSMIFTKSKDKSHANENAMITSKSKVKPPVAENDTISTKSKDKPHVNENDMISTKSKDNALANENPRISTKSKGKTPMEVRSESKTPKRRNTRQKTVDVPTSGEMIRPQDVVDAGLHLNPARKEHYAWFSLTPSSDQNRKDTLQLLVQPYLQITMDGECDPDVSILMKYIVLQLKHVCQAEVGIFMNGKLLDPEMKLLDVVKQWTTFVGSERKITKIGSSAENFCVKLTYARRE